MQIVILLFMSVIWYEILLADTFWQNSILCVCTTEGLSTDCWWEAFTDWLLEASLSSRRLAVVPCHVVLSRAPLTIWQLVSSKSRREKVSKWVWYHDRILCNVTVTGVTSHYLCHILSARSKLTGAAHTQGDRIWPRYKYQKTRMTQSLSTRAVFQ